MGTLGTHCMLTTAMVKPGRDTYLLTAPLPHFVQAGCELKRALQLTPVPAAQAPRRVLQARGTP